MVVNDGLLSRNHAELLHLSRGVRRERRVLSIDQARWILAVLGLRERLIVQLAGMCGMRPGEIVGLPWAGLTPEGLRVTRAVYRGVVQTPKTHHRVRTVALSTTVREDFEAWRAIAPNNEPGDWVFPSETG